MFGLVRSVQFMTSNTLSYADMPAEQAEPRHQPRRRAAAAHRQLRRLDRRHAARPGHLARPMSLTPERFHQVFLLMAMIPLLALPGFLCLRPEDGAEVSGHRRGGEA